MCSNCRGDGFTGVPRVPCRWHTVLSHAPGLLGRVLLWNQAVNALLSVNFLLTSPSFRSSIERTKDGRKKKVNKGNTGGFQSMGLSYPVYKGVMHMGYALDLIIVCLPPSSLRIDVFATR